MRFDLNSIAIERNNVAIAFDNNVAIERKHDSTLNQNFLELHHSQFSLKTHSKQGVFTHTHQNILVKTHLIIKERQFKYEQQHFISLLNIILQDDIQNILKIETNKATINFLL